MKMYVVRSAAFIVGMLIAGWVYAAHASEPAKGATAVHASLSISP